MPVEIRELIIRARVGESGSQESGQQGTQIEQSAQPVSSEELNNLISDFIKKKKER